MCCRVPLSRPWANRLCIVQRERAVSDVIGGWTPMELEGYDTVIFTPTTPRQVFAAFVASPAVRWPQVRLSVGWGDRPFVERAGVADEDLPAEQGELFAVRDLPMERHFS